MVVAQGVDHFGYGPNPEPLLWGIQHGRIRADLPFGLSVEVTLLRGQKMGDKWSPLLFGLVFNALFLGYRRGASPYLMAQGPY